MAPHQREETPAHRQMNAFRRVAGRVIPGLCRPIVQSGSWSSVGVSGGDAAFPQFGEHGGVVDVEVLSNAGQ
jgi:hypothetical protein